MILNGHFTLNFHYHELNLRVLLADLESIIYLFTVESDYNFRYTWPAEMWEAE